MCYFVLLPMSQFLTGWQMKCESCFLIRSSKTPKIQWQLNNRIKYSSSDQINWLKLILYQDNFIYANVNWLKTRISIWVQYQIKIYSWIIEEVMGHETLLCRFLKNLRKK